MWNPYVFPHPQKKKKDVCISTRKENTAYRRVSQCMQGALESCKDQILALFPKLA